jgi:hypothetical protein
MGQKGRPPGEPAALPDPGRLPALLYHGGPTVRRLSLVVLAFAFCLTALHAEDSPKVAKARKLLKTKVTCDYSDTPLSEVKDDLKEQVKGLLMQLDNKNGVSNNTKITYKAENKPLEDVLDEMLKKYSLAYEIIPNGAYAGSVKVIRGK